MTNQPQPSPSTETPERRLLREIAETSHRNGMALVRRARAINQYLTDTTPAPQKSTPQP